MPLEEQLAALTAAFDHLRNSRAGEPAEVLTLAKQVGLLGLEVMAECTQSPLEWRGGGEKTYSVFSRPGSLVPFSRPINDALLIPDAATFEATWNVVQDALLADNKGAVGIPANLSPVANSVFYTALMAYAVCMDLWRLGGAGACFEAVVRASIRALSGREDHGAVRIQPQPAQGLELDGAEPEGVEAEGETDEAVALVEERIPVDLSFPSNVPGGTTLVIAVKISTRERISQAFVHQLVLERLRPGGFRSAMVICNETNKFSPRRLASDARTPAVSWATETLVPGTIATYNRYLAEMAGLYYLDPPVPYLNGAYPDLPPVGTFGSLLSVDLAPLLI